MEKFYIALPESRLYADYSEWLVTRNESVKFIENLFEKYGLDRETKFYAGREFLAIKSDKDLDSIFPKQFKKKLYDGDYRVFKLNAPIMKEWVEKIKTFKCLHKPFLGMYFKNCFGKMSTRLFMHESTLYFSIECDSAFEPSDLFQEIKASEFYKVIEDIEEKENGKL